MLTLFNLGITQPLGNDGAPVPGGKLTFYVAGTTTKKDTFADALGTTPNTNPVILDAYGRAVIFLDNDEAYDVLFTDADDVEIWTLEDVMAAAPAVP